MQQTRSLKPSEVEKKWLLVDAEDIVLGRLATQVAHRLRGKHKPGFTPHVDCGDNVIIINADKVKVTGRKLEQKHYHWHTGWIGGIKSERWDATLAGAHPERLVARAIERMMPKTKLGRRQLSNLRVYAGAEHPHVAQQPEALDIAAMNDKNSRG